MLTNILLVAHLLVALAIVILVLLQRGKGADMGAAFGGGSAETLFGARGSANFLSRATAGLVTVFFLSSLTLAYIYTHRGGDTGSVTGESVVDLSAPPAGDDAAAESESGDSDDAGEAATDIPVAPE